MAEVTQYSFSHQEVVESLLRYHGIHEGEWMLRIEFGLAASNIGPSQDQLMPAAVVGILKLGIQKADSPSNLSVDAAKVNPAPAP